MIRFAFFILPVCFGLALSASGAVGQETCDAFLEPNKVVDISSPFRDRISGIHIREGDRVKKGQLLAELDSRVLEAKLVSAKEVASFHGLIDSAKARVSMQKNRFIMLQRLAETGNARPQEMIKAKTDLSMAEARLRSVLEESRLKKLEVRIIQAMIEEKKLHSPVDGVIVKVYKQEAELAGGGDQQNLVSIAQLNPLRARFHLVPVHVRRLKRGMAVRVTVDSEQVTGEIDSISPIINPQSGTQEVCVIIPNGDNRLLSGALATLLLTGEKR
jgi:RND family efflux transporter MFP subunit